jgi:hypothetical protein
MSQRRWFNQNVPQTLAIAQILLYIDAAFLGLDVLLGDLGGGVAMILGLAAIAAYVYGGYGIANEQKRGYQVAVVASFLPMLRRIILTFQYPEQIDVLYGSKISFIFLAGNVLNVIFEYALIGLLLHPMSRNHQKIWFS